MATVTSKLRARLVTLAVTSIAALGAGATATAHADSVAYLINVTVRPGYNFPNADAAFDYGRGICDKVARGIGYSDVMSDIKTDFTTTDEYQASYLVTQAVNELCPEQIWALRNSAAHYRPTMP